MTPTGSVTRFALPPQSRDPGAIIVGPDDSLVRRGRQHLAHFQRRRDHRSTVSTTVGGLTVGPDGAVWFTTNTATGGATVGRVEPGRTPKVTALYDLPDGAGLRGIVAGGDGNLWVAEEGRESIARVSPRGDVTQYTLGPGQYPQAMAASADGRLWFTFLSPRGAGGVARLDVPRQRGEQLVEALVALAHADLHAAGHEGVAALEGVDQRGRGQPGAAVAEVLEDELLQGDAVGHALEGEGLDDQLVRPHLVEAAAEAVLLAVAGVT